MADTAEDLRATVRGRPIADILAEWRAAERRLESADGGSAEATDAEALSEQLRGEYQRALDAHER